MGEEQHRRPAAAKTYASWYEKVETQLFENPRGNRAKHNQPGKPGGKYRWDPYDTIGTKDEIRKFFDGHDYRYQKLIDRERFAKFSIQKVLDEHPNDNFEITGEIMKNEAVVGQSEGSENLQNLADVIRADAHQDVDAETPRDGSIRSSQLDENEFTQKISAAAQSIIAASPNSLGPPVKPCVEYLKATLCGQYDRRKSNVWKSPFVPRLDNVHGRRGLLDHQVTAIVWLLSRLFGDLPRLKYKDSSTGSTCYNVQTLSEVDNRDRLKGPKYYGGILADSMGLGKTLIIVALIDLMISQQLNILPRDDEFGIHRPTLLVVPNATVARQWVQELKEVVDVANLTIIVSGPGLEDLDNSLGKISFLDRGDFKYWPWPLDFVWDEDDPRASRTVLITTIETWAGRTCYYDDEKGEWFSSFTDMGRGFSLVVVDEAHKVKNPRTKNWRSIYLLKRQFTLLVTATPCLNVLGDMFGLARLLWSGPSKNFAFAEKYIEDLEQLDILDQYPPSHDMQLQAGRPGLLVKMLFRHPKARTYDINLTRQYLRHYESLAMLKRSPSSYICEDWGKIGSIPLDGLFPKVENYTIDISPGESYDQEYQRVHISLLIQYLEGLHGWGRIFNRQGDGSKNEEEEARARIMGSIRLLQIASSSLDVYDLDTILSENDHSTLATEVAKMRENEVDFLRLAQFLILPNETKPKTHVGWMRIATRNSPILRYILRYLHENILIREANRPIKKLLIIENNLMLAFYYELVLQFLGFECCCLHAKLSQEERQQLVDSFNSSHNGSCQILIQLYTVGFAGTNLHKNCSRVLVASQSHSLQVQWQAIHRVIRVGQQSDVTVHRVKLKNSYHTFQESRQIEKILPELGARAQGTSKKVLVRLLNLFQYEVEEVWHSPEGQRLRYERNLLERDESDEEDDTPTPKRIKLKIKANKKDKKIKKEVTKRDNVKEEGIKKEDSDSDVKGDIEKKNTKKEEIKNREAKKIKKEEEEDDKKLWNLPIKNDPLAKGSQNSCMKKRKKHKVAVRMTGNGMGGWYGKDPETGDEESDDYDWSDEELKQDRLFLGLYTRDAYYADFLELKRAAKGVFDHSKNRLRRLMSYGSDRGKFSTGLWNEGHLEDPAVLERALELMLRVRLGAKDIAMLPFPIIDLSRAPASCRRELRRFLADTTHTDQDLHADRGASTADKDCRDALRGIDVKLDPELIDRDLEVQAKYGDVPAGSGVKRSKFIPEDEDRDEVVILGDDMDGDVEDNVE
ncbi:P-loop containing nucleoside triphosphate hydrolase protein [Xylaria arbuscula]|nr:P-loop containing nucleoside triphosphate hydrolase protein [Xylaria arbuscula]